ncbi:MAG: VWA domain-containing protein [Myxococcota bacterium]
MSLALLAPAALAAAVLLAGPILAHLAKRHPRDRIAYGAVMLLQRLQRRLARRRRLHDVLLLAIRLCALAALVLAAAQPELRRPRTEATYGGSGRVIVVLDDSLSMDQRDAGEPVFGLARREAAELVRGLPPGVRVAVVTAGSPAGPLTAGFTEDHALAATLLEAVEPTYGGTDLRGALTAARATLEGEPGEVFVFTDESGPGVIEACDVDLERLLALGSSVIPRVYAPKTRRNVAIADAFYGDGVEGGTVTVKLTNYGPDGKEVPTTVYLPEGAQMTAFVEVPGATEEGVGIAEERFTVPRQAAGGVARVEIDDPDLPRDNARWFHLPRVGASRVLVVDGDPGSSPTRSEVYFLERALSPWGTGGPAVDVVSPTGALSLDPEVHRVVFYANVGDPAPQAPALVDFVRRGGGLVLAMGDNVTAERVNGPLAGLLPAPLRRVRDLVDLDAEEGTPLQPPDVVNVELFRPFARSGREGFSRVRTRRAMTLEPYAETGEVQTLLRWTGGAPALLERRIGNGRVLLWTGTIDLGWGNLPLQSVFMPFVQRMTGYLGGDVGPAATTTEGTVGEVLRIPLPPSAGNVEVTGPGGQIVPASREDGGVVLSPAEPGGYSVAAGGPPVAWVAVNTPAAESDVRATSSLVETQARLAPDRMLERHPLALPLVALGAAAMLLAGVVGRGRSDDA